MIQKGNKILDLPPKGEINIRFDSEFLILGEYNDGEQKIVSPNSVNDRYAKVVLDPFFGNGDGTVPLKSADIRKTIRTYFIRHVEGYYSTGIHGSLPNNRDVQNIVRSILIGAPYRITGSPNVVKLVDVEPTEDFTLR